MSYRKQLSGSQKRKRKDEIGLAIQAQKGSILKFVRHENNEVDQDENKEVDQDHQVTAEENFYADKAQEMQQNTEQSFETDADTNQEITTVETVLAWDIDDIGTWPQSLNNKLRAIILERGPVRIEGLEYPKDIRGRKFTENNYYKRLSNGEIVNRRWLVYSKCKDAVFCFPCKIFNSCNLKIATMGINDWQNLSHTLPQHEKEQHHIESMHKWCEPSVRLKNQTTLDAQNQRLLESEKQHWRLVLERLLSIVEYLSTNNLAFRGSTEKLYQPQNGNFLGLVQLLGNFDTVMNEYLRRVTENEIHDDYLGPRIQNELIMLMSNKVRDKIVSLVTLAKYFAVILDCTPDISHKEQMSLVVRFVDISDSAQITVKESFITFLEVEDTTGFGLLQALLDELKRMGLSVMNIRGQGYDNGANMRGCISGVQARLLAENPRAFFVPCACHSLHLILCDMAKSSVEAICFFGLLQRIFVLFSASTEHWQIFKAHVSGITVKPLSETRWESRVESAKTLRYQSEEVYEALVAISEEARDPKAKSQAESLASEIASFKFLTSVVIWYDILVNISSVSKIMQSPTMQLDSTLTLLNTTRDFLVKYRENGFKEAQVTARELAEALGVEPKFPCPNVTRVSRKKRQAEDEGADEPIDDPEKKFEVDFFNVVMDKAISAVDERFNTLRAHHEQFGFLYDITKFNEIGKQEQLMTKCKNLESLLKHGDSSDLNGLELYEELSSLSTVLPHAKSVMDIVQFIHTSKLVDIYPNVYIATRILLTIPITVASGEQKLKLIKNYLRSTMSQEHLTGLAILSIEQDITLSLSYDDVITDFADEKTRKIVFN
ncbi:zinc finger MYM-type protein 1-like [Terrapene carolina triunguis]|uniref:zinc finger MYM-type protein 1-like n=1 Tax=Terrapene triunguis TaxID=2587831 RepID=UPI000E77D633|nr:zinc finger MYM-type protein 1-like [Terrapene carolina triunguis]